MKFGSTLRSLIIFSSLAASQSFAESGAFLNVGILAVDTDFDTSAGLNLGAGYRFNNHFNIEAGYNNFGDVGFGIDLTSLYYGLSMGGFVTERVRLSVIGGGERLEAKGRFFGRSVSSSGNEAYYGLGAEFISSREFSTRLRLKGHDSGDIRSLELGLMFRF